MTAVVILITFWWTDMSVIERKDFGNGHRKQTVSFQRKGTVFIPKNIYIWVKLFGYLMNCLLEINFEFINILGAPQTFTSDLPEVFDKSIVPELHTNYVLSCTCVCSSRGSVFFVDPNITWKHHTPKIWVIRTIVHENRLLGTQRVPGP